MKRLVIWMAITGLLTTVPVALARDDDHRDKDNKFAAKLSGYNEVLFSGGPPATLRGAVSTKARGRFKAEIDKDMDEIKYELSYEGLEGTVTQGHIHFGQRHTVGGIVVWLCKTATNAPTDPVASALTPLCPTKGTVTGTITPAQVLAQTEQGIAAGEFDELVRAIRAGAAYANVHSSLFPQGEIRGHIEDKDGDRKHHDDHHDHGR
jgi:CHRD domain